MNNSYGFQIFCVIMFIIGIGTILNDLYTIFNRGEFIIKIKQSRGSTIFWAGLLIFWCVFLWLDIKDWIFGYGENGRTYNIFMNIFWIEFSISQIIKSIISSEIRENGIYNLGYFYKWSKIKNYNWISPNVIKFEMVSRFYTIGTSFKVTIDEELKSKVQEELQGKVNELVQDGAAL